MSNENGAWSNPSEPAQNGSQTGIDDQEGLYGLGRESSTMSYSQTAKLLIWTCTVNN
ncbi:Uncharacterized protein FKW44_011687 [Caligus rogercresseyi]|uniref:Uncharacterized protein n=1 Tax=Caligus rogercresseyi TaxID=217165 RepID=A0A7T8HIE7_CALRO|nr:Uncharacterized protein FKW44_011687 [Caligus rogercresseyi]